MEAFEHTSLWKQTLGNKDNVAYSSEIEELRSTFLKFRKNASYLVSRISSILPSLTQHEISHLDALWDTASLIAGDGFPINPLEGFILGGAILVHDSALCFEAYENGQAGVRGTTQWKDVYAELLDQDDIGNDEDLKSQADFIALRELHALQAETLLHHSWSDPDNGEELFLLENHTLRKHFGKLIGQIAASHHWDIESLTVKLSTQQNTLPNYPREWRIDPIKIACLLRCADAAHLDNLRAPDFLHALLKRSGVSFHHWQGQNRLSRVDIDQSDPIEETLLFTSTIEFTEKEASSWFVAYDAICLVDKEIKASNALLTSRNPSISFKIKKVKGIESPESLAEYVKVNDWEPCSAKVHVGNIERLVHNLGGEMLYGAGTDLLAVAIRELIQNSRDSINARSFIEGQSKGKIILKIEEIGADTWLTVEDNGIGMSERVLTGPLLDFGTSFWTSSLVKSEFPGLRSSSFKSIGKFGIGFYSIFMIADQVYVFSRNWNAGLSETRQLKFESGFTLRPILKKGTVSGFHSSTSTQIKFKLKPGLISKNKMMEIKTNRSGSSNFYVPFTKYLSALCAGLDVSVFYSDINTFETKIHESINSESFNVEQWLKDISFSEYHLKNENISYISTNVNRLKPIIENGQILGLAAINTKLSNVQDFLSIATVGGLAQAVHHRDGEYFIGFIDYSPKSAKREIGNFSGNEQTLIDWATKQKEDLEKLPLGHVEKYVAATALCHFKVDPRSIAQILISVNNQVVFVSVDQLAEISKTVKIAFIESSFGGEHIETHHNIQHLSNYALVKPLSNSSFLSLKLNEDKVPENNFSILDCLYRSILSKGYVPKLEKAENVGTSNFNQSLNALVLFSEIKN